MHYHVVGIAGAGMSAVAHVLLDQGHTVSGSDLQQGALAEALACRGARIFRGHDPAYIAAAERVVITSAVKSDHPEVAAARLRGIPILKRADLWREWSQRRAVIAVAGTHGKTTTTAMITLVLERAGMVPGFLIGGEVPDLGTNARWGDEGAPLVIEADEYDRTFLALTPQLAVITNIEWDHVDIYPSQSDYEAAFRTFAQSVHDPRQLIICADDPGVLQAVDQPLATQYGIDEQIARDPVSCRRSLFDWMATDVQVGSDGTRFDTWRYDRASFATQRLGACRLRLAGEHNARNALAALATAAALGVAYDTAVSALAEYHGVGRRFELKGEANGVTVIDDYAHHPTEARTTLQAARRSFAGRRLIVYLQPHTYSRTLALLDSWTTAFDEADVLRIGEIYAARERDTLGIDSERLASQIAHPDVKAVGGLEHATSELLQLLRPGDVLLTLGAGDGNRVGEAVLDALQRSVSETTC